MKRTKIQIFIIACACMIGSFSLKSMAIPSAKGVQQVCAKWVVAKFYGGSTKIKNINLQPSKEGLTFNGELPFSFIYNGIPSSQLLRSWKISRSVKSIDKNREQQILKFLDPKTGLEVRCQQIRYKDFPVVEWTVYLKNTGTKDTPVLEDIQALNTQFDRNSLFAGQRSLSGIASGRSNVRNQPDGNKEDEFYLNYNKGGGSGPMDFQPERMRLDQDSSKVVGSFWGGFPTAENLPFFNVEWKSNDQNNGVIIAAGWPARWKAQFKRDHNDGLSTVIGQMHTHLILHPGEEIRTPLVALLFWTGDRTESQNIWRRWMSAYNVPRQNGKLPKSMLEAASSSFYAEMVHADDASQKMFISRYLEEGIKLDYWWMDAGWNPNKGRDWQDLLGTWEADKTRFPNGLRVVSDYAHSQGVKTILWFEPERVMEGSWLFVHHPEWLLGDGGSRFFNHGNPDANKWLTNHVDSILTNERIDLYRQDFAVFSSGFWDAEDAAHPDRQGITEIKHVMGYLKFFDELRRRHPDMLIDICAAGGKRLELENLRRAVPLWRSDYAHEPVGVQSQTYGLSAWLPYHGTGVPAIDKYNFRSEMCPSTVLNLDARNKNADYKLLRELIKQWRLISPDYYGDYYPLTPYSLEKDAWIGWEFYRPESGTGFVQMFRRADSAKDSETFCLKGLDPNAVYKITDFDKSDSITKSGKELLSTGLSLVIPNKSEAKVIRIEKLRK